MMVKELYESSVYTLMAHVQLYISVFWNLKIIKIELFHGNPICEKSFLHMLGTLINTFPLQLRIDGQK